MPLLLRPTVFIIRLLFLAQLLFFGFTATVHRVTWGFGRRKIHDTSELYIFYIFELHHQVQLCQCMSSRFFPFIILVNNKGAT